VSKRQQDIGKNQQRKEVSNHDRSAFRLPHITPRLPAFYEDAVEEQVKRDLLPYPDSRYSMSSTFILTNSFSELEIQKVPSLVPLGFEEEINMDGMMLQVDWES
jgi:hypothetical protein